MMNLKPEELLMILLRKDIAIEHLSTRLIELEKKFENCKCKDKNEATA